MVYLFDLILVTFGFNLPKKWNNRIQTTKNKYIRFCLQLDATYILLKILKLSTGCP